MRFFVLPLCVALACISAKEVERPAAPARDVAPARDPAAAAADSSMTASATTAPVTAIPGMSRASTAAMAVPTGTPLAPSAGSAPADGPAPGRNASAAAAGATALTASEAAASYAQSRQVASAGARSSRATAAPADDNSCESDADCAFTLIDTGACCPMLCAPRAVSKKQADALQAHVNSCRKGRQCPHPMCRPPPFATSPSCQEHRCVGKPTGTSRGDD